MPEDDQASKPYNPLEKRHLAESIVRFLLHKPCEPLGAVADFEGSGVYAIYYSGDFPDYSPLSNRNREGCELPIYVGKAIPSGGRVGGWNFEANTGPFLSRRLQQHAESIRQVSNLNIGHFKERHLVVADVFIPLAENLLIEQYQPLWNSVVDGFGNHDPGKGRYGGARPVWDNLHPGRPWAEKCRPSAESVEETRHRVQEYFRGQG